MSKLVKDFVEVKDCSSLDMLIERLSAVRDSLPGDARSDVRMRGDDIFGRHISVSFYRPQTAEEAECDARYADAYRQSRERELSRLQDELGFVQHAGEPRRKLRVVG
jgi:hypothetical protein